MAIKIGTCGWATLYQAVPPSERQGKSSLQAYAQRLLALHRTGKLPASSFGAKSVAWTIRTHENWPTTKRKLLEKCGEWHCWIAPDKSVKLKSILQHFRERKYANRDEVEEEAEKIWDETGYPSAKQVEKPDQLSG